MRDPDAILRIVLDRELEAPGVVSLAHGVRGSWRILVSSGMGDTFAQRFRNRRVNS